MNDYGLLDREVYVDCPVCDGCGNTEREPAAVGGPCPGCSMFSDDGTIPVTEAARLAEVLEVDRHHTHLSYFRVAKVIEPTREGRLIVHEVASLRPLAPGTDLYLHPRDRP